MTSEGIATVCWEITPFFATLPVICFHAHGSRPAATQLTLKCTLLDRRRVRRFRTSLSLSLCLFLTDLCSVALQGRLMYEAIPRSNHFLSASNAADSEVGTTAAKSNLRLVPDCGLV